ncbi:hypothetical protein QUA41_07465 [Microcoleus sp. Pol11C1]|uniref:hypothetical protein n=1 Tax=unclassified Microcoleus TaxID=2642155 RepID=UPI002FD295E6
MSRRDNLYFSLRRTLEKDGWTIKALRSTIVMLKQSICPFSTMQHTSLKRSNWKSTIG